MLPPAQVTMKYAVLALLVVAASAEVAPLLKAKEKMEGDYIIKLKETFDVSLLADNPILSALGGRTRHQYKRVLHGFSATLSEAALNFIRNSGLVEYVEEDGMARKAYSWGIDRVNQHTNTRDNNCTFTVGNEGIGANVFVIDSGVSPEDTEFGGRVTAAADFVPKGTGGIDCDGHGTHCSGTVGSVNYGIAIATNISGVRVLNCQGGGSWSNIIAGCDFVADHTAELKVASLSIGGGFSQSMNDAIERMIDADVAVAVAAGNENTDACSTSPASAPSALTVGATNRNDVRAAFSNFGSCVDIFAPGVDIMSTTLNGGRESWSGTSMATPHVAGVMALARVASPELDARGIMKMVIDNADDGKVEDPQGDANKLLYCP